MISSREKSGPSHTDSCYSTFAQCRMFGDICLGNKAAARLRLDALIVSADVSEKNRCSPCWATPASSLSFKWWGKASKHWQSHTALSSSPLVHLLKSDRGGWQVKWERKGEKTTMTRWLHSSWGYFSFLDNYSSASFISDCPGLYDLIQSCHS